MTQSAEVVQKSGIRQNWKVLLVVCLPLVVLAIDNSVLNLALPPIATDLGSSASQLQWVINAYILVFSSLLLTLGAIGDRYGRKRLFQIGLVLFGIGSLAAAYSTSTGMLIFFRAFLGLAGAMIMPSTLSIIVDTFRDPKERVQAVGIWAGIFALGVAIGPILGGYMLDYFWWGSLFLINIPVVVITFSLAYYFIRESKSEDIPKPDIPGMLLSIIGLFLLTYGIIEAGEKGWGDTAVLAYIGGGVLVAILFAVVETRVAHPMLPMYFFKNMSFTIASLAMILTMFALAGSLFIFAQYFQSVQGYSPLAAAIRLAPFALVLMIIAILSAKIAIKIGAKVAIVIGIVIVGVSLFWLSQISDVDSSYGSLIVGLVLMAVGVGMSSPPATDYIVGAMPVSRAGMSSAVNQATRQVGNLLGIAILGSIMNSAYREKIGEISVLSSLPEQASDAIRSGIQSAQITIGKLFDLGLLSADDVNVINDGARNAFVLGMNDAMFVGAFILGGTALFALIFLPRHVQRHDVVEHELEPEPVPEIAEV